MTAASSSRSFLVRSTETSPSGELVLEVEVPTELVYFEGHFHGNPMLPGVAQVLSLIDVEARRRFPELAALGAKRLFRVKFQATILPGDTLEVGLSHETTRGHEVHFRIERLGATKERASLGVLGYH